MKYKHYQVWGVALFLWAGLGLTPVGLAQAPTVESLLQKAVERGKKGDFEAAIFELNQAIKLAPTNATAITLRGIAYTNLGNAKQALEDFTKAIQLAPKAAAPYGYRGIVRRQLQDLPGALGDVNEAIKIDGKNPGFYSFRGALHADGGDRAKAISDFQQAAKLFGERGDTEGVKEMQEFIAILQKEPVAPAPAPQKPGTQAAPLKPTAPK
ncbi:Tetratricopeptide repeat-containing protein [Gloeomargarita lithophora Alchichica-D10]|uniref:Tetratricopeptide repeat-containing protein n=1 Tax=Gloeomargarita lithophora Alchichica-D10 TaxID=1188229 RepID=A0A1J0AAL9_9CYAN|nr:tetratricopeptide repeat protein [Gloeomargarita lithophora]APB32975.1 Tetratricopeptide repeat-containing protein [Gloeomargarita lithophora Alchichica-D10]